MAQTDDKTQSPAKIHSYILLDRTGSMSSIWDEALSSVNAYAANIAGQAGDVVPQITLAVFDAQDGLQFDVLRRAVPPEDWQKVTDKEASPRGMTPLFDAIARLISIAEADSPEKAVIVIMTDGAENASREVTKAVVKAALDRAEKRGWEDRLPRRGVCELRRCGRGRHFGAQIHGHGPWPDVGIDDPARPQEPDLLRLGGRCAGRIRRSRPRRGRRGGCSAENR
jgi:hypothetical protein